MRRETNEYRRGGRYLSTIKWIRKIYGTQIDPSRVGLRTCNRPLVMPRILDMTLNIEDSNLQYLLENCDANY